MDGTDDSGDIRRRMIAGGHSSAFFYFSERSGRLLKRDEAAKMAEDHAFNAVNRVEFQSMTDSEDPYRLLAAAVILQIAIDEIVGNEKFYWDYGRKVWVRNGMHDEDYQFYADLAGLNVTYTEILEAVSKTIKPKINKCTPGAAGIILTKIIGGKDEDHDS